MLYQVVHRSSGIPAFSTTSRSYAILWMEWNDTNEDGSSIGLYKLVKVK